MNWDTILASVKKSLRSWATERNTDFFIKPHIDFFNKTPIITNIFFTLSEIYIYLLTKYFLVIINKIFYI
jgi:hypothetical protein